MRNTVVNGRKIVTIVADNEHGYRYGYEDELEGYEEYTGELHAEDGAAPEGHATPEAATANPVPTPAKQVIVQTKDTSSAWPKTDVK